MNRVTSRKATQGLGLLVVAALTQACASSGGNAARSAGKTVDSARWTGEVATEMESRFHPTVGAKGMVVADDREAAEWGAEVLRRGGNAIDAAVATAFAMSVTRPHHSSLGGGGFMVYCPKPGAKGRTPCVALDYREEAPAAATRDMYIREGKARTDLSQNGALASGVPGVPAGLLAALEKYGSLPRQKLLTRPIALARDGFVFTGHEEAAAQDRWPHMNDEAKRLLGCDATGKQLGAGSRAPVPAAPCPANTRLRQPDLARVLEAISRSGAAGFYRGAVAEKLVAGLKASGGILTMQDLASYRPKWREPVRAEFRGMEVVSMPPPSAGGTVLLQMLGYAERADRQDAFSEGYGSARAIHAITHGMALAFADRAKFFGDPDHWNVPVQGMLSAEYLDARWSSFDPAKANLPAEAGPLQLTRPAGAPALNAARGAGAAATTESERLDALAWGEGAHTTHFSVIDQEGNAVAITTTINDNYGSGFVPPGTGVMMNNEMDDFSIQPGVPNLFGLVGAEANAVAARKRPLSSMSPTVVRDAGGNARIVVGAAGGPRITTSVYLSILNRLAFGMSLPDAVNAARVHQQWRPVELRLERQAFGSDTRQKLMGLGYAIQDAASLAKVHALERFPNGRVWGVPDRRGEGAAAAQ